MTNTEALEIFQGKMPEVGFAKCEKCRYYRDLLKYGYGFGECTYKRSFTGLLVDSDHWCSYGEMVE